MNPIPNFDHNNVLPPHLGSPVQLKDLSPYQCDILQLCQRFSVSEERIEILRGLIAFRKRMTDEGILNGFQWLDGSFLENIEVTENRAPNDLDLATFFMDVSIERQKELLESFPEFIYSERSKTNYKLDHYPVDYGYHPEVTVEQTRYWLQLFTHSREGIWKGILRLSLNTPDIDQQALEFLDKVAI